MFFLQTPPLPPPFPRDGATKLLENDRVVVWDVAWLRQAYSVDEQTGGTDRAYIFELK